MKHKAPVHKTCVLCHKVWDIEVRNWFTAIVSRFVTLCDKSVTCHTAMTITGIGHPHYIAYSSQFITSRPKYLTGVRHFLNDLYPDFDDNRAHPLVSSTIQGSKKIQADPVERKLPLHLAHLQSFLNVARCTGTYDNTLFIVLLTCAFYGCHRMGELVQKNDRSLFDWRKIIKWASLTFEKGCTQYCLPYHKGDPFYQGCDVILTTQDVVDPVVMLRDYVQKWDCLHGTDESQTIVDV